jgi:hypothetical protein
VPANDLRTAVCEPMAGFGPLRGLRLDSCWAVADRGCQAVLLCWQVGGGLVMTGRDVLLFPCERALQRWLRRVRYRRIEDLDWLVGARFEGLYRVCWTHSRGTATMLTLNATYLLSVTDGDRPQYMLDEIVTVSHAG